MTFPPKKPAVGGTALCTLTKSEYAICELLALHAGQTFSKEQIYEAVFGYDGTADDTAITQHIKNIRAKLRAAGLASPESVLQTDMGSWLPMEKRQSLTISAQRAAAVSSSVRRRVRV